MDKPSPINVPWILGLDLGTNSIGWAALKVDDHHNPIEILNAGVRIFPAGTDGDISTGNDASRAVERREARLRRRQTDRRRRRKWKLMKTLQDAGLLPGGPIDSPERECAQRIPAVVSRGSQWEPPPASVNAIAMRELTEATQAGP